MLAALGAIAALLAAGAQGASAAARCGPQHVPGGEWPTYGHDYANTRYQQHEKVISPADVPLLSPAWTASTTDAGGKGDITGTPVVAFGCVYVATNRGWAFAFNADTGQRAWKARVPYGGNVSGSVGVTAGRVYLFVSRLERSKGCPKGDPCVGPYVVALNRRSGRLAWATRPIDRQAGSDVYGSPVIFDGVVMVGVSGGSAELGDEADRYAFQGSMNFLDARTGRVLRKTWTIHRPDHPKDDFAGAGIWSTPAIDRRAKVAYVGTGNPFRPQAEHKHANAVLKLDVDRHSPRFGRILDSYKGSIDEYVPGFSDLPCYDFPGNAPPYYPQGLGSCGDLDMDFGASPNLIQGPNGRKLVGEGQKSGIYHVFDAKTMKRVWTQPLGPPSLVGGIVGSTAYDGRSIYGPVTVPGYLWSVSASSGSPRWFAPVGDGAHYGEPVAVANGVVYTVDLTGFLDAYDARTGALLDKRPLALGGTGTPASLSWGGVSVARHTIYAAVGVTGLSEGFVVAFRPGGVNDVTGDLADTAGDVLGGGGGGGGGGENPVGAAVVAGPGAASTTYATPVMITQPGGPLSFVNLDVAQHDVTAEEKDSNGRPLFQSRLVGLGESAPVEGLDRVQSGETYRFYCSIHPGMQGSLIVR
jgi:polyvinyl alcohol dehydrogenase (cytochrome)